MMMRVWMVITSLLLSKMCLAQEIPIGSVWQYYDLGNAPPNQSGVNWKQLNYDDVSWDSGPAELGYGDGDESTVISSSTLTGYYRHVFQVDDPGDFDSLDLAL